MKWYEHRFGDEDSRAKYSSRAGGSKSESGLGALLNSITRKAQNELGIGYSGYNVKYGDVNPKFNTSPQYQNNCVYCTTCYDLNRRGYNAHAGPAMGFNTLDIGKFYKGGREATKVFATDYLGDTGDESQNIIRNRQSVIDYLNDMPVGARGNVCCQSGGKGHSMAWEKFGNGMHIIDCQSGHELNQDGINHWFGDFGKWFAAVRTDNLDIDDSTIDECLEGYDDGRMKKDWEDWSINYVDDFLGRLGDDLPMPTYLFENREDYLEHYGVKGMKWKEHVKAKAGPKNTKKKKTDHSDEQDYKDTVEAIRIAKENGEKLTDAIDEEWFRKYPELAEKYGVDMHDYDDQLDTNYKIKQRAKVASASSKATKQLMDKASKVVSGKSKLSDDKVARVKELLESLRKKQSKTVTHDVFDDTNSLELQEVDMAAAKTVVDDYMKLKSA